ncbi:hypothetical protein EVAR_4789_1 [Eumeta japonica]|uniref:Uncharacterized protein n=1 Tax=Eumeta variegata TaxID=151549 RepID=A0A4C1T2B8_EUMVA|nr:hypothetical protein EVAR_4789_1 [Eumeta japonica]
MISTQLSDDTSYYGIDEKKIISTLLGRRSAGVASRRGPGAGGRRAARVHDRALFTALRIGSLKNKLKLTAPSETLVKRSNSDRGRIPPMSGLNLKFSQSSAACFREHVTPWVQNIGTASAINVVLSELGGERSKTLCLE